MRQDIQALLSERQTQICARLEALDGAAAFTVDPWQHAGGGGGVTRILERGRCFEKAGVNLSNVWGPVPEGASAMFRAKAGTDLSGGEFFVSSLSLVIHPQNPMVPIVHANYRYFEISAAGRTEPIWWFGGGTDLTPSYLFEEDVRFYHQAYRAACDRRDREFYPRFKAWCDDYFFIRHRGERRGTGGIFFDDLTASSPGKLFPLIEDCTQAICDVYVPIVRRRSTTPFDDRHKRWQDLRRGRYVEFNLMYDRGTTFGLRTGGRVESILMSLPPTARWGYTVNPEPGSPEAELMEVLVRPREWA
jgi:coproporphyrinogen III oxidase